jgi:DcuC family C4-dicarboxylate transporter
MSAMSRFMGGIIMLWIGFAIILITIYCLMKQYETRLVLFVSGVIMAIISGNLMVAFDAFSKSMKNANLIEPIIAAMGFAMVLQITKCDQHLIYLLAKSLKNLGPALVPGAVLATALVNTSITSAGGCSAAVGAILIPVLIGSGVHPAMAAAAVFAGTYGSPMLNPGFGQIAIVADVAHSTPIDVISNHYHVVLILGLITAASLTVVAFIKGEHKGYHCEALDNVEDFKINYIMALVPMLPLIILVLGSTGVVPLFKKFAISHAMLIGCFAAFLATRKNPAEISKAFFKGAGDGFATVFGIITMALVFVSGVKSLGIIDWMIQEMINTPAIAKVSATVGPFLLGVISGSGEAASIAFNQSVTIHADTLGLNALNLGSLAAISGALGRTMSPIAGCAIICAGFAKVNPLELVKRTALGMIIAVFTTMVLLMYI